MEWVTISAKWECLECDTDADGGTPEQVRGWARNHAAVTGHMISVTVVEREGSECRVHPNTGRCVKCDVPFLGHRSKAGFTLIEAVLSIMLIGLLAAIAIPRFVSLTDAGQRAAVVAWNDAAEAALNLDFARQQLSGGYVSPFQGREGRTLTGPDRRALEQLLDRPLAGGRWILVRRGGGTEIARVRLGG